MNHYTPYLHELNMQGIPDPVPINMIPRFEQQNEDIAVNILGWDYENKVVIPLFCTQRRNRRHIVNLFLVQDIDEEEIGVRDGSGDEDSDDEFEFLGRPEVTRHYTLVRNLSRLVSKFSKDHNKCYPCAYCLHRFSSERLLIEHQDRCSTHPPCRIDLPLGQKDRYGEMDNILKFNSYQKCFPVPFVVYLDFESFIHEDEHIPSGFCTLRVSTIEKYNHEKAFVYSGPNVMETFFKHLDEHNKYICKILKTEVPMSPLSKEQSAKHTAATNCTLCDEQFTKGNHKVRHHCHLTGNFLSTICNRCNLSLRFVKNGLDKYRLPVICHNSKNYDIHLILKNMTKDFISKEIRVIATSSQKYTSFQVDNLIFIDSCQFLPTSLSSLVETLKRDGIDSFKYLRHHYTNDNDFNLLVQKGVFPYEYLSDSSKFEEETLPPPQNFYDKLNDQNISDSDYQHAQTVWNHFQIKTFQEYHDLYLKSDVLLLADVFENFRTFALKNYQLDPAHFTTLPGLSWAAALKMTKVRLELMCDIDMLLFAESAIRGGVATVSTRYARANNPYMGEGYNPEEPTSYIHFVDANSLYGFAMGQKLPRADFKWLSQGEIENFNIDTIPERYDSDVNNNNIDGDSTGYVLEVDLQYPESLHDLHSDFPLAVEKITPHDHILSEYQRELKTKLDIKGSYQKLIPNLYDKRNYITHIENLKYYISKGLVVTKIHRILSFTQSAWLKPYIQFNVDKRKLASTAVEKDSYKLFINSVFGRSCFNARKYKDIKIVHTKKRANTLVSRPNYAGFEIINDDLIAINMTKTKINWRTPTIVGSAILELSKIVMYRFHYDVILPEYGTKASLLYTDTDSLMYHITTPDIYKDMSTKLHYYDTSDYDREHCCYSDFNKKRLGSMKDECMGIPAVQFVGLRSKMYSLLLNQDGLAKKTVKGIKKSFVKNKLTHESYLQCLHTEELKNASFYIIKSRNHVLKTTQVNKICLSCYDDKRYIVRDQYKTLAYGHYKCVNL